MKRRKPPRRKKATPTPVVQEDLNATSRAVYGLEQAHGRDAPAREAESVEDPVLDWPESAAEADQWLNDHGVRRDEEREG